ncbi:TIGR04282 family arsenosugar biosynthesis glycosyltransferase [Nocardioides sp. Iso805N]|uniref:TIGR04282 family arsenosugar biosynthesis glycosyltransferase n=1 Tax=Nocardioides sp. Iso805N TaxID=1283287 RepID=UPI00035F9DA6|nr:DUF2064 domain-containing protein [Nocardioides sp. Iso805N]
MRASTHVERTWASTPVEALTLLVVAKAPVPGVAKTRLAADVDDPFLAAELAAAALLDTIALGNALHCRRRIALTGDLGGATRGAEIRHALADWEIVGQRGDSLGERLAAAHAEVSGPIVQVGMDTPQITPALLSEVVAGLRDHDAVLGPASDGGWWVLALRDGRLARPLAGVRMSTPTTYADTRAALAAAGLVVASAPVLTDVDHLDDALTVADAAPATDFARCVRRELGQAVR